MISYAQNFEDVMLNRVFRDKPKGFYIDVGSHDPAEMSVTKHFYDLGWCGINIEPVPESYQRFVEQRPRDTNLNLAIGERYEIRTLYVVEGSNPTCPNAAAFSAFDQRIAFCCRSGSVQLTIVMAPTGASTTCAPAWRR